MTDPVRLLSLPIALVGAVALALSLATTYDESTKQPSPPLVRPVPKPTPKPAPTPAPQPAPKPKPTPPKPWPNCGYLSVGEVGEIEATVDGEEHSGVSIDCPLPADFHTKNVGGRDGAGLCVFCSMHHSGLWANEPVFAGIFDFMKKYPGGGYPEKVTKMVAQYAKELGVPEPDYLQVTGGDLTILKAACQSGRMPGVTYSFSPTGRYGGGRISHMVSLVHASEEWFVILDNNFVTGEKHLEWLTPAEFSRTYAPGWAVIPLKPGPPYAPKNGA